MRIVYKNKDNTICIIIPTEEVIAYLNGITITITIDGIEVIDVLRYQTLSSEDKMLAITVAIPIVAEKDVPTGLPYWIRPVTDIPTDRTYREAWEVDPAWGDPDGFGGENNEFDAELLEAYDGNK